MLDRDGAVASRLSLPRTASKAAADSAPISEFVMEFLDRSILRERRMEALWKRAARGPFPDDFREDLRFESYEDREHARILRRHRATFARTLPPAARRAPGSRATKVGRTLSPAAALSEALALKAASRAEYVGTIRFVQDRFLRKFVEVLAHSEDLALPRLIERAGDYGIRPRGAPAPRPSGLPAFERDPMEAEPLAASVA